MLLRALNSRLRLPQIRVIPRTMSTLASERPQKRMRPVDSPLLGAIRETTITAELAADGLKIGTHDGKFHCDEALACAMLKLLPEFQQAVIVRTRRGEILSECDVVVDVGAVYDPESKRFDHHQKTFSETLEGYDTKLSSAGLVYKHYGREIIREITRDAPFPEHLEESIYQKVYRNFVEHIDGIDNGVEVGDNLKYSISTSLSSRVGRLHPSWNEDSSSAVVNECFREAMLLTGSEFVECVIGLQKSWWPARHIVEQALAKATEVDESGQIILLETFCPWQSHLFDIEAEQQTSGRIKYALYQDSSNKWRIHAVPVSEGSFSCRLPLPEAWRGVRDTALDEKTGLEGCTFVHAAGFIGGHATQDGALKMAQMALQEAK